VSNVTNERKQSSLEKWLVLRMEQKTYKMSLHHITLSECKEVLKKPKEEHVRDMGTTLRTLTLAKVKQLERQTE
jgi:hypothetical protein